MGAPTTCPARSTSGGLPDMPVRFQVDPDFYDHPKVIGLSDAAVALWARAGSYSTAKLLDGFVPEHALAMLSRTPDEAAAELVARGLWRRTKGGFRFHQWADRNLTRERVEADRKSDRDRKRRTRSHGADDGGKSKEGQVKAAFVRPDSDRTPTGGRVESDRIPDTDTDTDTDDVTGKIAKPGSDGDPHFAAFWSAYPRKVGKGQARKAWTTAVNRGVDLVELLRVATEFGEMQRRTRCDPKFIPHPATWLNGERWLDREPDRPAAGGAWWDN